MSLSGRTLTDAQKKAPAQGRGAKLHLDLGSPDAGGKLGLFYAFGPNSDLICCRKMSMGMSWPSRLYCQ